MSCALFVPQMLTWDGATSEHFVPKVGGWTVAQKNAILDLYANTI